MVVKLQTDYIKDLNFLNELKLGVPIKARLLEYDFAKSMRRKKAMYFLLRNKSIPKSSLIKFFNQKRDLRFFINDIVNVHDVAKENISFLWLNPEWVEEQDLFIKITEDDINE